MSVTSTANWVLTTLEKNRVWVAIFLAILVFASRFFYSFFDYNLSEGTISMILPGDLGLATTHSWGPIAANIAAGEGF